MVIGKSRIQEVVKLMVGCVARLAERWSVAGELTLSHAWPAADG